jgi:fructose-specific phosphotransferase system IIC component
VKALGLFAGLLLGVAVVLLVDFATVRSDFAMVRNHRDTVTGTAFVVCLVAGYFAGSVVDALRRIAEAQEKQVPSGQVPNAPPEDL